MQGGELGVDRGEFMLGSRVEPGSGPHEVGVLQPGEPLRFGPEAGLLAAREHGGDPVAESLVLHDPVGVGGQPRCDLPLDLLHRIVAEAGGVGLVDGEAAFQRPPGKLVGNVRVGKRGRLVLQSDPFERGDLFRHAGRDRRLEVGGSRSAAATPANGGTPPHGPVHGRASVGSVESESAVTVI